MIRLGGLLLGPVAAILVHVLLPETYVDADGATVALGTAPRGAAAVAACMATWWITEAIPVYVTALLPLALFPLLGTATVSAAAQPYGHEIIYLFLGGFMVALALERWGLHRRVALTVLAWVGSSRGRIVGAFMALSAFTSMWVTNTAATIMLTPVAVSVIRTVGEGGRPAANDGIAGNFGACLLLGIAYASSIGGMGTIIGTAPNVFVASFITSQTGRQFSFLEWMLVGVPLVLVLVPCCWWLLCRVIFRLHSGEAAEARAELMRQRDALGPVGRGERLTLIVFVLTALGWIARPWLVELTVLGTRPLAGLTDTGVAVLAALALFVTPVNLRRGEFLMNWETALRLPWGLLILFGGGLSLAAALDQSGFSRYLGTLALALGDLPQWLFVAFVVAMVVFLTEVTSNTATTATLIPVLYAVAVGLHMQPLQVILPACFAASCAFMLPVATPPNAVIFGTGFVAGRQMARAGLLLNLLAILLITVVTYGIVMPALGIR